MTTNSLILSATLVVCGVIACSSDAMDDSAAHGGSAGSSGSEHTGHAGGVSSGGSLAAAGSAGSHAGQHPVDTAGMGGLPDVAGVGGAASGAPEAPLIKSVEPLEGGLHVVWMNVTTDCDKIELLRSKDGGAYDVAYTLAGVADSQHDAKATAPGMYCYRAVCVKGTDKSPESNEKCATP